MRTDDFDYKLPDELIAQAPAEPRDSCRVLVLHRGEPLAKTGDVEALPSGGSIEHKHFYDIIDYIEPGDVLVINKTRVYPYEAYKRHIAGRVVCSFIVDIDGSICNVSVVKGANALLDKEAVRVIKEMPDWKAGKLRGEPVPVRCFLPIPFRL